MILFVGSLAGGLVGVIFIGTVNILILPIGSFLTVDWAGLSGFSSVLAFSVDGAEVDFLPILPERAPMRH